MPEMTMQQMVEVQEIKTLRELDDLTGLLEIFVFISKFERANISNFIKDLRLNQQPVYRTLNKLTALGLVEVRKEPQPNRASFQTKYYYLTPKGKELGNYFVDLFEIYRTMK